MTKNITQTEAAKQEMIQWLSHENELGKSPRKIECTDKFSYLNMTYYIFKFKKSIFDGQWYLGVCGGYDEEGLEHCGHILSEYKEYTSTSAIEEAIKLIEIVRDFWKNLAKKIESGEK